MSWSSAGCTQKAPHRHEPSIHGASRRAVSWRRGQIFLEPTPRMMLPDLIDDQVPVHQESDQRLPHQTQQLFAELGVAPPVLPLVDAVCLMVDRLPRLRNMPIDQRQGSISGSETSHDALCERDKIAKRCLRLS